MFLRADLAAAWAGQRPLDAAFALRGELLRSMPGRQTLRVQIAGRAYIAKLHSGVSWWEVLKNLLVGRLPVLGAGNEYRALQRLHQHGVPTMDVAAFDGGSHVARARVAGVRSFIVLDLIEHEATLEDVARSWRQHPPSPATRRSCVLAVASIARAMHAAGVNHRDFYLCHFLCARAGGLRLIDLHRAGCRARVPQRWRTKDLAALYFSAMDAGLSRRDQLRFIRCYEGGRLPRGQSAWARWQGVNALALRLYDKGRRLGIVS